MTRKDYELIAGAINAARRAVAMDDDPIEGMQISLDHVDFVGRILAIRLSLANPRFDRARFLRACGMEG